MFGCLYVRVHRALWQTEPGMGGWNSVCGRCAPAKELEWANMGLGFRRPSPRTSETKILEQANWNSCEHIGFSVKYVNGSCQIFADIMLSNEDMKRRVNLLKIFSVITQYVEL